MEYFTVRASHTVSLWPYVLLCNCSKFLAEFQNSSTLGCIVFIEANACLSECHEMIRGNLL